VKKAAMNGGEANGPRDIADQDFNLIGADGKSITWIDGFGKEHVITVEERRRQALEFWRQVQKRVLGGDGVTSAAEWKERLGISIDVSSGGHAYGEKAQAEQKYNEKNNKKRYSLQISGKDNLHEILHNHGHGILFTESLLGKSPDCRSNLDDVIWFTD
jgi:hypothetical protein